MKMIKGGISLVAKYMGCALIAIAIVILIAVLCAGSATSFLDKLFL